MNGKRIIAVALMAALCLTGITLIPVEKVKADTEITYLDAFFDTYTHEVTYPNATASCVEVKDLQDKTKWGVEGEITWYAVTESETIDERVTVSGTVNLILCDDITLTAGEGITVNGGNALNIYGQSDGTGTLYSGTMGEEDFSAPNIFAGIGGSFGEPGGTITINGGNVIAYGGECAAGIGGGDGGSGGTITINGGTVEAKSKSIGAGIGGGQFGSGGTTEINGGSVMSIGDFLGAGIGGGAHGEGGNIIINGGSVTATGGDQGAGIGGGDAGEGGNVTISGGYVEAYGGEDAEGIGRGKGATDSGTLKLDYDIVCYNADTMTVLQPDSEGYIGFRTQHMKTVYVPEEPPIFADYTCEVNGKVKIPVGKKVKKVTVEDETIASAKKKGKKVIVTGKAPGTVNVTAYGKKNKVLGNWIVKVE